MICPDARTAKEVTFDQKVSMKSITQDGNIYNPSGTLSGGSKPSTSGILIKVLELKKVISEVEGIKRMLNELKKLIIDLKNKQKAVESECKHPDISKKKSDINKSSTTVKIMQKELQGIEMETEKLASELEAANTEAEETDQVVELAREEHEGWKEKLKQAKYSIFQNLTKILLNQHLQHHPTGVQSLKLYLPKEAQRQIRQLQPPDPKVPKETRPIEDPMTPGLEGNQGEGDSNSLFCLVIRGSIQARDCAT
ncbi:hypothetical protein BY996DRAFT_6423531 [Phakopsora pachyrhizi]|nr:hypothetical protein BY996DRAFT_6423531 [Phakopsora pachyrhizi]